MHPFKAGVSGVGSNGGRAESDREIGEQTRCFGGRTGSGKKLPRRPGGKGPQYEFQEPETTAASLAPFPMQMVGWRRNGKGKVK